MKNVLILLLSIFTLSGCTSPGQKAKEQAEKDSLATYLTQRMRDKSINQQDKGQFGIWEVGTYSDEFGDATDKKYVNATIYGKFSDSVTDDSDLRVSILIDKEFIRIQLYEYALDNPIKDRGLLHFRAKDSEGEIYEFYATNMSNGSNIVDDISYEAVINLLLRGGKISFIGIVLDDSMPSKYKFTINNADHLEEALKEIQ